MLRGALLLLTAHLPPSHHARSLSLPQPMFVSQVHAEEEDCTMKATFDGTITTPYWQVGESDWLRIINPLPNGATDNKYLGKVGDNELNTRRRLSDLTVSPGTQNNIKAGAAFKFHSNTIGEGMGFEICMAGLSQVQQEEKIAAAKDAWDTAVATDAEPYTRVSHGQEGDAQCDAIDDSKYDTTNWCISWIVGVCYDSAYKAWCKKTNEKRLNEQNAEMAYYEAISQHATKLETARFNHEHHLARGPAEVYAKVRDMLLLFLPSLYLSLPLPPPLHLSSTSPVSPTSMLTRIRLISSNDSILENVGPLVGNSV